MLEFVSKKGKSYCILDGKKMSDGELIDEMISIILWSRKNKDKNKKEQRDEQ